MTEDKHWDTGEENDLPNISEKDLTIYRLRQLLAFCYPYIPIGIKVTTVDGNFDLKERIDELEAARFAQIREIWPQGDDV